MSDPLSTMLGVDPESDGVKLAIKQLEEDSNFLEALIAARQERYIDLSEYAEKIGAHPGEIERFEADPVDFDLSFIRAYAHGLGLFIGHSILEHG